MREGALTATTMPIYGETGGRESAIGLVIWVRLVTNRLTYWLAVSQIVA